MHILEMQSKIQKTFLLLEIKSFEIVAGNNAYFQREYLSSEVNVLTKSLNISDMTKGDFFQLNLPLIYGKVG